MTGTRRFRRGLSIGPNWSGWSKSNGRLAPTGTVGANRTIVWPQLERLGRIERPFGPNWSGWSKSNGRLAPTGAVGANRTVVWPQLERLGRIEQLVSNTERKRSKRWVQN